MADISTVWRDFGGDWVVQRPSLLADDGLKTAIVLSLFTDRLAEASDALPAPTSTRRGWWGDAYADVPGDLVGSRLWLLFRSKQLQSVLRQAEEYAAEALQWLVDDGVASSVTVAAEVPAPGVLGLLVTVVRSGQAQQQYRFEAFWKGA